MSEEKRAIRLAGSIRRRITARRTGERSSGITISRAFGETDAGWARSCPYRMDSRLPCRPRVRI